MRWVLALLSMLVCARAEAAQLTQVLPDETVPFAFFDPALGTLDTVVVQFLVPDNFEVMADVRAESSDPVEVTYDLFVPFAGHYFIDDGAKTTSGAIPFIVRSSGTQTVALSAAESGFAGRFSIFFGRSVEAMLDPALFYARPGAYNFFDIAARGDVTGLLTPSRGNASAVATDGYGTAMGTVQLIYNYTPAVVPEPSTWALLIVGFGLIGGALRNRTFEHSLRGVI